MVEVRWMMYSTLPIFHHPFSILRPSNIFRFFIIHFSILHFTFFSSNPLLLTLPNGYYNIKIENTPR